MRVNYEEKTYENYFNIELSSKCDVLFPPGQVQEGFLGFDSSVYTMNRRLMRYLGHPFWFFPHFIGAPLIEIATELENCYGELIRSIPAIKVNLLFQYKRPDVLGQSNAKEWNHWGQEYYRYGIEKHQQERLVGIHSKFGSRVLVVYAAPAIKSIEELVNSYTRREIISTSNFKKCVDLDGHTRNTYIRGGLHSIACSEPKRLNNFDLLKEIKSYSQQTRDTQGTANNKNTLVDFVDRLSASALEDDLISAPFKKLLEEIEKYKALTLSYRFLTMSIYRSLTGIQWGLSL